MTRVSAYQRAFVTESAELLQALNEALIDLEKEPDDLAPIEEIFRVAHSLKGMAATMGYDRMAQLTHQMENILDLVRQRQHPVTEGLVALIFECLDTLQEILDAIASGRAEADVAELIDKIGRFQAAPVADMAAMTKSFRVRVVLAENCVLKSVRAYMVIKRLNNIGEIRKSRPSLEDIEDEKFGNEFELDFATLFDPDKVRADIRAIGEVETVEVVELAAECGLKEKSRRRAAVTASESLTVRVGINHLDNLVNLVGELVIARSRLEDISHALGEPALEEVLQDLQHLTGELQYEVMRTRMVPVGNIFSRFPRMVRDTAKELGKKVNFVVEGSDIELDRIVLDEIGDPLVHLLRNAVGHGIEEPRARVDAGKPETGTIMLSAERAKNAVVISVEDDGAGLDPNQLRRAAVEDGFLSAEEAESLRDEGTYDLICRPGFTTRSQSDDLAGRGVGMDAVKGKIEALGGTLSIHSEKGKGSHFLLELPLTLAIVQALMVTTAGYTYALPLSNVVEVSSLAGHQLKQIKDEQVFVLHDKVVPLVWLDEIFGLDGGGRGRAGGWQVAVVRRGDELCGLVVEELLGRAEVVVKPLAKLFGAHHGIGGVTVLGDGRLALVIDVRTLDTRSWGVAKATGVSEIATPAKNAGSK